MERIVRLLVLIVLLQFVFHALTAQPLINKSGTSVFQRFDVPMGFERIKCPSGSFGYFLQKLPLKDIDARVAYYDGRFKEKKGIYVSVVDMELDPVNLQQCADAVMRLRGEYLFNQNQFEKIHFNFASDANPRYFTNYSKGDYSYITFRKYMRYIFAYANTRSLKNELQNINLSDMQVGNVLIQSGNPYGHAVIVVDMCLNHQTGEKLFMLAQSYMPAQDTQILCNPDDAKLSPWYRLIEGLDIKTPEWRFNCNDLYRFRSN